MVVTGKGYGMTNLIALDRAGAVLMEKSVEVHGPRAGIVVVYRGVERETYSCTPNCERRITLGDGDTYLRRHHRPDRDAQRAGSSRCAGYQVNCRHGVAPLGAAFVVSKVVSGAAAFVGDYHNNSTTSLCYCSTVGGAHRRNRLGDHGHVRAHDDKARKRRAADSQIVAPCGASFGSRMARRRSSSAWWRRRSSRWSSPSWRRRSSSSPARRWKPRSPTRRG